MAAYQDHLWLFKYMALIVLSKYANLRKYAYIKALHLIIKYRHFTVANQTKQNELFCWFWLVTINTVFIKSLDPGNVPGYEGSWSMTITTRDPAIIIVPSTFYILEEISTTTLRLAERSANTLSWRRGQ